jgi:hypothetical protein
MKSELEKVFQMENIFSGIEFWKTPEPVLYTLMEQRNRFRQAGNRFLGFLKGLKIRALQKLLSNTKGGKGRALVWEIDIKKNWPTTNSGISVPFYFSFVLW